MSLQDLENIFRENFTQRGEVGASVSIWKNGEELLNLADGWCEREKIRQWNKHTIIPVYSATKGPAAATMLHVLSQRGLDEKTLVSEVWPSFPAPRASFAELLSHQCGLAALDHDADVFDHTSVIASVEQKLPEWELGEGHGYHPRTMGFLLDECVRRLENRTLGAVWNEEIARPMGVDFWIGLPQSEFYRVAKLIPGRAKTTLDEDSFYAAFHRSESLTSRSFSSPKGLKAISEMNESKAWEAGLPAMGGLGTARGLAQFYQIAIGAIESPFSEKVRSALGQLQICGEDRVLLRETAFTCGCQKDPLDHLGNKKRFLYGNSKSAFGHPGAGGSHGFGDPELGISFAYVMNQMELNVMPSARCSMLVERI